MSGKAEKLQDAIGLVKDEYILEAHGFADGREALAEAAKEGEASQAAAATTRGDGAAQGRDAHLHVGGQQGDATGQQGGATEQQGGGAKPQGRIRRWPAKPLAIAACLVIALGVGALAFTNMTNPARMTPLAESAHSTASSAGETGKDDAVAAREESMPLSASEVADGAEGIADTDAFTAGEPGASSRPEAPHSQRNGYDDPGAAFVLTAGVWNDNDNWPFFGNLVSSGAISFPSYGIDPTRRVKVTVTDGAGQPVRGEAVVLRNGAGEALWTAKSGKDGTAYLFYQDGQEPATVEAGGQVAQLAVAAADYDSRQQGQARGQSRATEVEDVTIRLGGRASQGQADLQVMFIVDTTGSMSDEIAFLQKDFASIAREVGSDGISYSVNFYRDKGDAYVTKCNEFTSDITQVQSLLNAERADGGGDEPEAVADILAATITNNPAWREGSNKVAFLVFDAPPHGGYESVLDAAVRNAAERGIRLVPVVASNASRDTELFGRALAICTQGTYVFLTDDSGVGNSHLEPIVGDYDVELLHDVIVRIIRENR